MEGLSLPSRERGLKPKIVRSTCGLALVAPFAGAWIETQRLISAPSANRCRSLRGSVD